ncbi:prolipoprotein diacylglyceryl transferase [Akkermansiaceae bacterium]|nr:prolipoprotein diacylglyceryl transferase [Akkermansiaceae bacterium]MDB4318506.1 prolipoprotein diacylglyceryl transferase [bacterium]MDB4144126.1 prolipoprotein diacylglyceryl transferase [Akkermansiaceae bacterium]MDB4258114.1 prolipoprotein diacylglyceryl transferase [Akkermansiaceae bacterium]MDB4312775.1 prolipoprotein diacylglyceryl transferase [Akkermansiaceae bacterium]
MLANYVHDLSPVIVEFTDSIKLRWYGLAYVAGFMVAYAILLRLSRRKLWVVPTEKVSDVVTYTALFGVFLGGRLGYVLFYMIPEKGLGAVLSDPVQIVRVWDGGMSSHGGIFGIAFFTLFYAWKNKVSWPAVGDGIAIVAPLGVFFGRVANFINGELYGTKTAPDAWYGVKFPAALYDRGGYDTIEHALFEAATVSPEVEKLMIAADGEISGGLFNRVVEISREDPAVLEALGNHIAPRHASQLYEGFLEGALIFAILYFIRVRFSKLAHGVISGLFFILYAIFRIIVETVREPDLGAEKVMGLSKGQFYSTFMILIGIGFLVYAWRQKKRVA